LPVVLINPFEVSPENDDRFLKGWERAAEYMREQPGFISSRLHRALSPDARFRFINVAEWESAEHFHAVVSSDEFQTLTAGSRERFPHYPALYEVIRT
jgi:heme oxygenase (mycobilin-producing)